MASIMARRGVPVAIGDPLSSDPHVYYNRTAYEPNYEEMDSGDYEMGHMNYIRPKEKLYETIPDANVPDVELQSGQSAELGVTPTTTNIRLEEGYTDLHHVPPASKWKCICGKLTCAISWLIVSVFLLIAATVVMLLLLFGCKFVTL